MLFIDSPDTDPYFNLALEEYIFEHMDRSERYLMLWQNENTIVVGVHQNTAQEINASYVREHRIRVVRRLSGGGAVYHDKGNLNYTIVADRSDYADFNFRGFVLPVIDTLKQFGIEASFSGRNDVLINGKKFSGNAQYVRHGRILHHGCIMLDSDLETVTNALQVREIKYRSKGIPSVRSRMTTINSETSRPVSMTAFRNALVDSIRHHEASFSRYTLTPEDYEKINRLKADRYETWDWNYGTSPAYDVCKEAKFDAGLVTAFLSVDGGRIASVRFYGDFFSEENPRELEEAMRGIPLDENLRSRLEALHVGRYMSGMTADDLARLLQE